MLTNGKPVGMGPGEGLVAGGGPGRAQNIGEALPSAGHPVLTSWCLGRL